MDIKITQGFYLPREHVKYYASYESNYIKNLVKQMKKEGTVLDLTAGKKVLSVIFLLSGDIILTNVLVDTLNKRLDPQDREQKG